MPCCWYWPSMASLDASCSSEVQKDTENRAEVNLDEMWPLKCHFNPIFMCPLAALLFGILSLVLQDGVILQYCFREYLAEYQCNNSSRVSWWFRLAAVDSCLARECRTVALLSVHDKEARGTHWGACWCLQTSVSIKTSPLLIPILQCVSESYLSGKVSNF